MPYFSGIYGCVYLAVGDLDFDLLALRDASGRGHGTASGAQDGESQPEDAFGRTSGDQFRGVAEPHALPREEVARRVGQQLCEMFQTQRLPREEFAAQPPHFAREAFETHLRGVHRGLRHVVQLQGGAVEPPVGFGHPFDQPSGHRRRGLERRVGHHVGHAGVLVVPDARHHRQRELRHVGAEAVGVEAVEVAPRPASADQHHGVEFFRPGRDVAQGFDDGFLGRFALHEGVEQGQLETVGASGQLLAEVLIAGGVGARHDGHALHDGRHRRLAVHVPDALLLQLRDGLLPLPLHVAQRVNVIDMSEIDGVPVSSSAIRECILRGDTERASEMLGRRFFVSSIVRHGKSLGKKLGFPTVNLHFEEDRAVLSYGVYIGEVFVDAEKFPAVVNVGLRPTAEENALVPKLEAHIVGFDKDLYGKKIRVEFVKKIRDEKKFDSLEDLKNQVEKDIEYTKKYFNER